MPLRDLLKKKDKITETEDITPTHPTNPTPEFTFVRSDTHTQETIRPPVFDDDYQQPSEPSRNLEVSPKRGLGRLRKGSQSDISQASASPDRKSQKEHRRISDRLHLGGRDRSASRSSTNLPENLPEIKDAYSNDGNQQDREAQWEARATILISKSPNIAANTGVPDMSSLSLGNRDASPGQTGRPRSISDAKSDVNIQDAIQLHENGQLEEATEMFRKLAESGNVLSQVLYGLSLRHGWGCTPDTKKAVTYLSAAASNSATIEAEALQAGIKKGGAAKGELVLAMFELANCFRHGWGVNVDKAAARQYYETAANLGDTDAMNEAAWCYLEGFGGKKDKVSSMATLNPELVVAFFLSNYLFGFSCHF